MMVRPFLRSLKGDGMESIEKAKIRIDHWIDHNKDHLQEYEAVAVELESVGE